MKRNFVSIVIPTFNEEKNIENTLRAIKNQDWKRYEVIVSDAKSEDRTRAIARKYGAKVVIDERKGIGAGRNFGARFARGDILLFIDADSVVMWNTISELVKQFQKKTVVGATCAILPLRATAKNVAFYATYNKFAERSMKRSPIIAGVCAAYRKKDFDAVGGFDEKMAAFEDTALSRTIAKRGRLVFTYNTFILTSPRRVEQWGFSKIAKKYVRFYFRLRSRKNIPLNEYRPIRSG